MVCPVESCARPVHDGWGICDQHSWQLERNLGDVAALVEELDTTLSRQTASGGRNGSRGSEKPLPFDVGASEAIFVLHSTLMGWVGEIEPDRPPIGSCASFAGQLLVAMPRLRTHRNADEAVSEIGSAVAACWRAVDRRGELVFAGRCGAKCAGILYARPDRHTVICPECGAEHDVAARRKAMRDDLDGQAMTAARIAQLAACFDGLDRERARKLINKWAERGVIEAVGIDLRGNETYLFGAVVARLIEIHVKTA